MPESNTTENKSAALQPIFDGLSKEEVLLQQQLGNRLNVYTTLSGKQRYNYLPEPVLKPSFLIVEEYRLSNFLGQYGAGRTVKTFSLLPGEKTLISINSYKKSASSSSSSSSILDSYTESKADEFESSIAQEQSSRTSESKNFEYHAEAEAKVGWGWGSVKASGGTSGGSDSAREEFAQNTAAATEKHAATSSASRDVEINTNFQVSEEAGVETSISREIQNINVGRTLNFTFRQMNQEFISILHLVGIKVAFFNGYAESKDEVPLSQLTQLVEKYVVADKQAGVIQAILDQVQWVYDYQDQPHEVIESVNHSASSAPAYWRFKKNLLS
ncbi:MAG: hypothetical protein HRU21_11080, partial [Pseudomonadales bacterium]|nr:hypothetical protein [Pseudomonadales bacterium]